MSEAVPVLQVEIILIDSTGHLRKSVLVVNDNTNRTKGIHMTSGPLGRA